LLKEQWIRPKNMEKQFVATQKYLIISPRKVRDVVDLIKKLSPLNAITKLEFIRKRSSELLIKVIKTALGQAKAQGVSDTDLVFKEIMISEGPRLKRGRAASRGRWHPYKKRMSHIRIVLVTKEVKKAEVKAEKKVEVKKEAKKVVKKTVKKGVNKK
jgi:large subunit ribosomal protein L22